MAKNRYIYNPATCRYEPFYVRGKLLRKRIIIFLTVSLLFAGAGYYWSFQYFESIDEMMLGEKNKKLKLEWDMLHHRIADANVQLAGFIEKDDHNYRVILDSSPLPASIREAGTGGSEKVTLKT